MGIARVESAVVIGVEARPVGVEVHLASGLPGLALVGLPDAAVNESRDRVRAAVTNSGLRWPTNRITVGLSPAWLPKRGPGLDLAIAVAVLAADGQVPTSMLDGALVVGELGLDGRIKPVAGALAVGLAVSHRSGSIIVTGERDAEQISLVPNVRTLVARTLRELVCELRGDAAEPDDSHTQFHEDDVARSGAASQREAQREGTRRRDLAEVKGQAGAKRAVEIAAAGGHHIAMFGQAGVGKSLLAERLVDLLPDLPERASLEVTSIHQLAGRPCDGVIRRPPCEAPHHTASRVAMVGGGSDMKPSVGVVSLAHRGVLLLDEAAEFEPRVLDALREPVDAGSLTVVRAGFQMTLPARIQLVLTTNPCPCGNALDTRGPRRCTCTASQRRKYLGRLSGPLLDRVDLRTVLSRPTLAQLREDLGRVEPTAVVAARVASARTAVIARSGGAFAANCDVPSEQLETEWPMPLGARREVDRACAGDSMRGRGRIIRLAWTLADLHGRPAPREADVEEAVALRRGDGSWGTV